MNPHVKISKSSSEEDYSEFLIEKSSGLLKNLANVVDSLNVKEFDDSAKEELLVYVSNAACDATKLLAFACDAQWHESDKDFVVGRGKSGLKELMEKYGLLKSRAYMQFLKKCEKLLQGRPSPNRTLLHDLIFTSGIRDNLTFQIEEELEKVSMGELDWFSFTQWARELIKSKKSADGLFEDDSEEDVDIDSADDFGGDIFPLASDLLYK